MRHFLALLCFSALLLSVWVPPQQSPDETDHVVRAYLLSQGQWLLHTRPGENSGGFIDAGLHDYNQYYYGKFMSARQMGDQADTVYRQDMATAQAIRWSGGQRYATAPGTGYYFPLIYAPQALGLTIGKALDWTVDASYRLARLLALLAFCALAALAFRLHPPNALLLGLLALPMTLFQLTSAGLDGVSTGVALVAAAAFLRLAHRREHDGRVFVLLCCCVFLAASSRLHLSAMCLLIAGTWIFTRRWQSLVASVAVGALIVLWVGVALSHTTDLRVAPRSLSDVVMYYVQDPVALLRVYWYTVTDEAMMRFYGDSFIGVLGWLDIWLPDWSYGLLAGWLALLGALTLVRPAAGARPWPATALLVLTAFSAVFMASLALLLTWSNHPAEIIQGLQGRYFLVPALLLAYAGSAVRRTAPAGFSGVSSSRGAWSTRAGEWAVAGLLVVSAMLTAGALRDAYFLAERPAAGHRVGSRVAGYHVDKLTDGRRFEQVFVAEGHAIRQVRLLLATYGRRNEGEVTLTVLDDQGRTLAAQSRQAVGLKDNRWVAFSFVDLPVVPQHRYTLRLTASTGDTERAVTWLAGTPDPYPLADAYVDGQPLAADFAFEVEFLK